jgi:hypothetical protein
MAKAASSQEFEAGVFDVWCVNACLAYAGGYLAIFALSCCDRRGRRLAHAWPALTAPPAPPAVRSAGPNGASNCLMATYCAPCLYGKSAYPRARRAAITRL